MPAVRFSEFMQRALYDPQRGYYTARIQTVGARGDFSTSATASPLLGKAIAVWLQSMRKTTPQCPRTIIEIGGGSGHLMEAVLAALGWWQRRSLQVLMVEASPVLAKQQQQRLGTRVHQWFATLPEALAACNGEALIFHNELLDAFPVDLVQWQDGAWQEVWNDGGKEELRPLTIAKTNHSVLRTQAADRQRCELHTAVHHWFQDWLPAWKRGAMLTIDYGGTFPALYHRRPKGTLRGYLMQQRLEGPEVYANPGRQDITCDINFTDVRAWLTALGTQELGYETQRAFIQRIVPAHRGDEVVTLEEGAGGAFQCLTVQRG